MGFKPVAHVVHVGHDGPLDPAAEEAARRIAIAPFRHETDKLTETAFHVIDGIHERVHAHGEPCQCQVRVALSLDEFLQTLLRTALGLGQFPYDFRQTLDFLAKNERAKLAAPFGVSR